MEHRFITKPVQHYGISIRKDGKYVPNWRYYPENT